MIIVTSNSYQDSVDAFEAFCDYLETEEPGTIIECIPEALQVTTDEDLTYLFLYKSFAKILPLEKDDVVTDSLFFERIEKQMTERYSEEPPGFYSLANRGWVCW